MATRTTTTTTMMMGLGMLRTGAFRRPPTSPSTFPLRTLWHHNHHNHLPPLPPRRSIYTPPPPRRPPTVIYTRFPTPTGPSGRRPPRIPLRHAWRAYPPLRYGTYALLAFSLLTYLTNLERVPISNRLRFNLISPALEASLSTEMYTEVISEYRTALLPPTHKHSRAVKRILTRLLRSPLLAGMDTSASTMPPPEEWEVHIIHSPATKNAFVLPGGKVFVFSGILPLAPTDSSLATILSHELAHVVAHHTGERVTQQALVLALLVLAEVGVAVVTGGSMPTSSLGRAILDLGFLRPASRRQEAEADYIGLMVMAEACFDPREAVGLWERMEAGEKIAVARGGRARKSIFGGEGGEGGDEDDDADAAAASVEIPQFLSTHPAHKTRIGKLKEWMPEALERQARTDCTAIKDYANQFKKMIVFDDGFGGRAAWVWPELK
ncbi:peptidase family M48-domain-containing protein [Peziza echinospora]|nr:peptidase family M48-domain-containing protein [Peziza echinospora]